MYYLPGSLSHEETLLGLTTTTKTTSLRSTSSKQDEQTGQSMFQILDEIDNAWKIIFGNRKA